MQDIRNFFSLKPAKEDITAGSKLSGNNEKKGSRKRAIIDSDSEEDPPIRTPNKKPTRNSAKSKIAFSKKSEVNKQSKYFEVDTTRVKSLFGTEPVKQVMAPKQPAKLALNESELADVSAAFLDIDDDDWAHTVEGPSKLMASGTGLPTSQKVDFYRNTHRTSSPEKLLGPNQTNKRSFDPEIEHGSPPEPEDISPAKKLSSENRQMLETPAALTTLKEKKFNGPVSSVSNLSSPVVNSRKLRNSDPFLRDSVSPSTQGSSGCLSSAQSSSSGYSTSTESRRELFELWVDKYKPTSLKQIIGQQSDKSNVVKLIKWLSAWDENQSGFKKIARPSPWAKDDTGAYFKAALLSGPPGVGKTTTAHLVCRELGLDLVEFNASDTRSKKLLHQEISELLTSKSLNSFAKGGLATSKRVLIMDEVDGMAGNEDRGGMQELIDLIKNTKIPVICMCNDRNHPKIRSLVNYCFDLRFFKPKADQIKGAMLSICFKERIKIKPDVLANIIASTNQDVRLVLNHLSVLAARKDSEMAVSCKEVKLGAWDVLRQVFSETDHKTMTIHDKMDLFFHDYSIAPLFVQENYLNVIPHAQESQNKKGKMKLFAEAALALSHGDMIDRAIRSQNAWSLLPTQVSIYQQ
ncbi:replication factor C (activator 1) 1, 145kDa [Nesidiocoris tenuis]|uniref:Replication factor C (Activator 1) 1, 145kDa n=1 Tax=Nesidiocoris tenuis TaxID=355587 RepID=A0ABN7AKW5_9HEMI|nr:replication factor C (activator 1) 1, 145kDa [Nesidiocoris tenuis]